MPNAGRRGASARTRAETGSIPTLIGILFFLVEIVVIPGGYSPFRQPKMALALGGLAVIVGLRMASGLWSNRLSLPTGRMTLILITLPFLQALSALWAQCPRAALEQALSTAVWVVSALYLASIGPIGRRTVLRWAAAGAVISGLVLVGQSAGFEMLAVQGVSRGDRLGLTGLAGNPSDLAMASLLLLPLLLPRFLLEGKKPRAWATPVALAIPALLTQTLTGLAAAGLLLGAGLILARSRKMWILTLVSGIVVALLVGLGPARSRIDREISLIQRGNWFNLLSARGDGWTAALLMIEQSPLTGVGAGNFSREFYPARSAWLTGRSTVGRRGETATHFEWTHNDALQLIAELGLVGAGWILAFLVTLLRSGRRDPTLVFTVAAWTPFLLLHYPTHLAVGLIPAALFLAHRLSGAPPSAILSTAPAARKSLAVLLVASSFFVVVRQAERLGLDLWRGRIESLLHAAERAPAAQRRRLLEVVETEASVRVRKHPEAAAWLWRIIGRERLLLGNYPEAEAAFRRALSIEPHEESEMGVGLALAGQGHRTEAIHFLARACRVNPALLNFIGDTELRDSVRRKIRYDNKRSRRLRRTD